MHVQEIGAGEWLAGLSTAVVVLAAFALTTLRLLLVARRRRSAGAVAGVVESVLVAGVLVLMLIRPFVAQAFYIPTGSMEPTLMGHDAGAGPDGVYRPDTAHDQIFAEKLSYHVREPRRGDIVVFRAPKEADYEGGFRHERPLVKRVVGVPGDEVLVSAGAVRVNGRALATPVCSGDNPSNEPCIREPMGTADPPGALYGVGRPLKLGPGEFFVMGDNRNASSDSRFWGIVTRDRIMGRAAFRFWPLSRFGLVR